MGESSWGEGFFASVAEGQDSLLVKHRRKGYATSDWLYISTRQVNWHTTSIPFDLFYSDVWLCNPFWINTCLGVRSQVNSSPWVPRHELEFGFVSEEWMSWDWLGYRLQPCRQCEHSWQSKGPFDCWIWLSCMIFSNHSEHPLNGPFACKSKTALGHKPTFPAGVYPNRLQLVMDLSNLEAHVGASNLCA